METIINMGFLEHIKTPLLIVTILLVAIIIFTLVVTRKEIDKK